MVVSLALRVRNAVALSLLLLALAVPLSGLGRGEADVPEADHAFSPADRVRMLLVIEHDSADPDTPDVVLSRPELLSAVADLSASAPLLSVRPRVVRDTVSTVQVREEAASDGALLWMYVRFSAGERSVSVRAQAGAITSGDSLIDLEYEVPVGPAGISYRRLWQPLQRELEDAFDTMTQTALGAVGNAPLHIQTIPGARIWIGDKEEPSVADGDGRLSLALYAPATYDLLLRAPGYYPVSGQILLTDEGSTIAVDTEPRGEWMYDLSLQNMSFPSFDARRRILGDYAFAQAGFTTYILGLASIDEGPENLTGSPGLFTSTPATDIRVGIGSYLTGTDARRRVYTSLGVSGRLIHGAGMFALDPVAPATAQLSLGLEGNPDVRHRLFFEWSPTLIFTDFPAIIEVRFPAVVYLPQRWEVYLPAARFPVSLGIFRLGVRFQP
ncbi:MAG: hypothetical protein EA383_17175 [Spirochaetaceae bacterium]|nr:MAG: hypothetical protein EA383_17175 [Spirochaetaceae bacterium]